MKSCSLCQKRGRGRKGALVLLQMNIDKARECMESVKGYEEAMSIRKTNTEGNSEETRGVGKKIVSGMGENV